MGLLLALGALKSGLFFAQAAPIDKEAIREAEQADAAPDDRAHASSYAHYVAARLLESRADFNGALRELKLALATDASSRFLNLELVDAYAHAGQWRSAKSAAEHLLWLFPKDVVAQNRMAALVRKERELKRAQVHLKYPHRLTRALSTDAEGR
jgi:tetratricopeptide (TPR) repeat protein